MFPVSPFRLLVTLLAFQALSACSKKLIVGSAVTTNNSRSFRYDYTSALNYNSQYITPFERYFQTSQVPQLHSDQQAFNKASQVIDIGWNGSSLSLTDGRIAGSYQSAIIDAGDSVPWKTLLVKTSSPSGLELPDNSPIETGFDEDGVDMKSNILLLHLNETGAGTPVDASREKNGVQKFNTVIDIDGRFAGSQRFSEDNDDRILVPELRGAVSDSMTIETWVKVSRSQFSATLISVGVVNPDNLSEGNSDFLFLRNPANLEVGRAGINENTGVALGTNAWHHVAVTLSSNANDGTIIVYRDGVEIQRRTSGSWKTFALANARYCVLLGEETQGGTQNGQQCLATDGIQRFEGLLDEIAIHNQALSGEEIRRHYQRGVSRYSVAVRSCSESSCSSSFVPVAASGPLYSLPTLPDNRYFQYKIDLARDSTTTATPRIKSVEVGPNHYYSGASVTPVNAVRYQSLSGFKEELGPIGGNVRYQLSPDGTNWYFSNGMNWVTATNTLQANSAADINGAIGKYAGMMGPGTMYFRAILNSASGGTRRSQLAGIEFMGEFN